jgi:hypothetical protein
MEAGNARLPRHKAQQADRAEPLDPAHFAAKVGIPHNLTRLRPPKPRFSFAEAKRKHPVLRRGVSHLAIRLDQAAAFSFLGAKRP